MLIWCCVLVCSCCVLWFVVVLVCNLCLGGLMWCNWNGLLCWLKLMVMVCC